MPRSRWKQNVSKQRPRGLGFHEVADWMLNILVPLCIGIILAILLITLVGCDLPTTSAGEKIAERESIWKEMEPGTDMMIFQLDEKTIWCLRSYDGYPFGVSCILTEGNYAIVPKE